MHFLYVVLFHLIVLCFGLQLVMLQLFGKQKVEPGSGKAGSNL
uniref:Uncharacterized protein n=1 Tax=Arundo donax TaxID=35708 RepID=A0A0A9FXQ0_ARUDO